MKSRLSASQPVPSSRVLRLEVLESRICPSNVVLTPGAGGVLLQSGDVGVDGVGTPIVQVTSGEALVFVTDNVTVNGSYDPGELTGIALAASTNLHVIGAANVVNGDIVTNLDADGTLSGGGNDGSVLLLSNISGLTLDGGVHKILAGVNIANVSSSSATEIRNGSAAGGQSFSFGGGTLDPFTPADGAKGGDMTNINIGTALTPGPIGTNPLVIVLGDGGSSTIKKGEDAGKFDHVIIFNNADVNITGGQGGDGLKGGGGGSQFTNFTVDTTGGVGADITMNAGGGGSVIDVMDAKGYGGVAGDFKDTPGYYLHASGGIDVNTSGGLGGNGTKLGGTGSSVQQVECIAHGGDVHLIGTDGGSTPTTTGSGGFLDGKKGRGGLGGHVTGQLNFHAIVFQTPFTTITSDTGFVTISSGNGGIGGKTGGTGAGIFGLNITAVNDVTLTAGNGRDYDPNTGATKGSGGNAGTIDSINITTDPTSDVLLTSGNGGGGSSGGQTGGTIGFVYVLMANNVTFLAGDGGGLTATTNTDSNTRVGGAGGSILNNRVGGTFGIPSNPVHGDVTFIAGNGYTNATDLRAGGVGGIIDQAVIETLANHSINLAAGIGGAGGTVGSSKSLDKSSGGAGGTVTELFLTGGDIAITAGVGGNGLDRGGDGGEMDHFTLTSAGQIAIASGNGGDTSNPTGTRGGDGGNVQDIIGTDVTVNTVVVGTGGTGTTPGMDGTLKNVVITP